MPSPTVIITDARLVLMAAFEVGAFSLQHDEKLRLARSEQGWLAILAPVLRRLAATDTLSWDQARIAESKYRLVNERIGASTLAAQEARKQMPLLVPSADHSWKESSELYEWRLVSVSIGPQGAACIRHQARLIHPAPVDSVITGYHILVQDIYRDLTNAAGEFLEGLSKAGGPLESVEFEIPEALRLGAYLASYEAIDIRFSVSESDLSALPAKRLIDNSLDCARQLAALSRMTKTEPDHLDADRLRAFKDADIGNREDELWIVNSNRMLRSHPDRDLHSVTYFYDDVLTLIELALHQLAAMEYVDSWLHEAHSRFRRELVAAKTSNTNIGDILLDIERVLDLLVQPGNLILGIRHPFFRKLADRLVGEMRISMVCEQTQSSLSIFTEAVSATFSYRAAISSDAATATIRRLSWAIMIATLLAALIATVALVLNIT